ncbi:hypothetical protein [Glacieibacterium sp.]|uniref:hypothetical protein n=1 Tax=Glacieibacterium sp. TaxID=2860237 RepID=UPI003B00D112
MKRLALGVALAFTLPVDAQELPPAQVASIAAAQTAAWKGSAKPVREIVPLFGRTLAFDLPRPFVLSYQVQSPRQFLQESAPIGERSENWTRLATVNAFANAGRSPTSTADLSEQLFRPRACTTGPIYQNLGEREFAPGIKVTTVSIGCASLPPGAYPAALAGAGEQDFAWLFRDATNVYTLKLSVRGKPWPAGRPPIPPASAEKQLAVFGNVLLCAPDATDLPCRTVESFNVARRSAK